MKFNDYAKIIEVFEQNDIVPSRSVISRIYNLKELNKNIIAIFNTIMMDKDIEDPNYYFDMITDILDSNKVSEYLYVVENALKNKFIKNNKEIIKIILEQDSHEKRKSLIFALENENIAKNYKLFECICHQKNIKNRERLTAVFEIDKMKNKVDQIMQCDSNKFDSLLKYLESEVCRIVHQLFFDQNNQYINDPTTINQKKLLKTIKYIQYLNSRYPSLKDKIVPNFNDQNNTSKVLIKQK